MRQPGFLVFRGQGPPQGRQGNGRTVGGRRCAMAVQTPCGHTANAVRKRRNRKVATPQTQRGYTADARAAGGARAAAESRRRESERVVAQNFAQGLHHKIALTHVGMGNLETGL